MPISSLRSIPMPSAVLQGIPFTPAPSIRQDSYTEPFGSFALDDVSENSDTDLERVDPGRWQ